MTDDTLENCHRLASAVAIGKPERQVRKPHIVVASNNGVHPTRSLYHCLFATRSLCYCLFTYIWVLFFASIPFVVNHTFNATPTERLQQHPLLFATNRTDRTFFCEVFTWHDHSYPGHSTILLRLEILSGVCAKLHTVAASNNIDHPTRSLLSLPSGNTVN